MKKKIAFLITLLFVLLDQIIKVSVCKLIPKGNSMNFIGNIIKLTYVTNTGAAYSLRTK